jgi:predicted O-methyltransferase YrrM
VMNAKEAFNLAKKIPGWLSQKEGQLLYTLAKSCKKHGVIVEIGSFKGRSTVLLALGSKAGPNVKVYAVDPHTYDMDIKTLIIPTPNKGTLEEFLKNMTAYGVDDIVIPVNTLSKEAFHMINNPVELVFIDGDHDYASVKLDYHLWFPRLISGGVIAFHDNDHDGPKRVIKEFITARRFAEIKVVERITYATKR